MLPRHKNSVLPRQSCDSVPLSGKFWLEGEACYIDTMRTWPRTVLAAVLGALIALALATQGAGATGMDAMMAKGDPTSSQHMPCGGCDGDDPLQTDSCTAPCLGNPAILSSAAGDDAIPLAVPASSVSSTGPGEIRAPDPNPPQL